eukprot:1140680-Pelagomonas_calceolata.AAC.1
MHESNMAIVVSQQARARKMRGWPSCNHTALPGASQAASCYASTREQPRHAACSTGDRRVSYTLLCMQAGEAAELLRNSCLPRSCLHAIAVSQMLALLLHCTERGSPLPVSIHADLGLLGVAWEDHQVAAVGLQAGHVLLELGKVKTGGGLLSWTTTFERLAHMHAACMSAPGLLKLGCPGVQASTGELGPQHSLPLLLPSAALLSAGADGGHGGTFRLVWAPPCLCSASPALL